MLWINLYRPTVWKMGNYETWWSALRKRSYVSKVSPLWKKGEPAEVHYIPSSQQNKMKSHPWMWYSLYLPSSWSHGHLQVKAVLQPRLHLAARPSSTFSYLLWLPYTSCSFFPSLVCTVHESLAMASRWPWSIWAGFTVSLTPKPCGCCLL